MLGSVLGFFIKELPHKWNDTVLGYCAGIMLLDLEDPSKVIGMSKEPLLASAHLMDESLDHLLASIEVCDYAT